MHGSLTAAACQRKQVPPVMDCFLPAASAGIRHGRIGALHAVAARHATRPSYCKRGLAVYALRPHLQRVATSEAHGFEYSELGF